MIPGSCWPFGGRFSDWPDARGGFSFDDVQLRELHFYPLMIRMEISFCHSYQRISNASPTTWLRPSCARALRRRHPGGKSILKNGLARSLAPHYDGLCAPMHGKAGLIMTIKMRKLIVIVPVASILLLAHLLALSEWLDRAGVVGWARSIRTEYVTGTGIAVIAAMLILLPPMPRRVLRTYAPIARCPVCDESLRPAGRYCPACGSRV